MDEYIVCTLLPFPSRTYCPNCGEEISTEDPYYEDHTLECPNCGHIIQEA